VPLKPYYGPHAGITIYHGDCREVLAQLPKGWCDRCSVQLADESILAIHLAGCGKVRPFCEVMVTDPPYGVAYSCGWANEFKDVKIAGDEDTVCRDMILEKWTGSALVFGSWKMPRPADTRMILTWDKGTVGMGDLSLPWFPCTEEIYVIGNSWVGTRTSAVMRYVNRNTFHPTEKPVELLNELLLKIEEGSGILDPFMGSGSTLVAAKDLGHRAIGIEIEEKYCEIAAKRLNQEVLKFPVEVA
jgi:DNA modification methylase